MKAQREVPAVVSAVTDVAPRMAGTLGAIALAVNIFQSFLDTRIDGAYRVATEGTTLKTGDIVATGTPSGVGMGFTPPRFL